MTRMRLVPIAMAVVFVVTALVLHGTLIEWFTGGSSKRPLGHDQHVRSPSSRIVADPPREKGNTLHLHVTTDSKPVTGAKLEVRYVMPAMGAMAEMRGTAEVSERAEGREVSRAVRSADGQLVVARCRHRCGRSAGDSLFVHGRPAGLSAARGAPAASFVLRLRA